MADFLHDNDETLLRYLDGEMEPAEKAAFESHLQNDMALQQKLERLQVAIASVRQYGTVEKVRSIHSQIMPELSPVQKESKVVPMRRIVRYSLAVAASIIIIFIGVSLFTSSQLSSEKLYKEAFVDYDASGVRGGEGVSAIVHDYQEHNYTAVITESNSQRLTQQDSLLVGLSYLKTNKLTDAIGWFKSISVQNPNRQDAEFYLAMSYLKNKNYSEALDLMQGIRSNPNHIYRTQFTDDYFNKVKKLNSR